MSGLSARVIVQRGDEFSLDVEIQIEYNDEDFDLDHHLERTKLADPAGLRELHSLMAYELSQVLEESFS